MLSVRNNWQDIINKNSSQNGKNKYPVSEITADHHKFHCIPCGKNVKCEKTGKRDIINHNKMKGHHDNLNICKNNSPSPFLAASF